MFGIGGALGYQPAMMIPAQYLRRNRSLAAGICICGSGMGGLAMSPVCCLSNAIFEDLPVSDLIW